MAKNLLTLNVFLLFSYISLKQPKSFQCFSFNENQKISNIVISNFVWKKSFDKWKAKTWELYAAHAVNHFNYLNTKTVKYRNEMAKTLKTSVRGRMSIQYDGDNKTILKRRTYEQCSGRNFEESSQFILMLTNEFTKEVKQKQ